MDKRDLFAPTQPSSKPESMDSSPPGFQRLHFFLSDYFDTHLLTLLILPMNLSQFDPFQSFRLDILCRDDFRFLLLGLVLGGGRGG